MTDRGRFTEVQGPAEREPFEQHTLGARLNPLWAGIHELLRRQAAVLDEWGIECGTAK
jgi:hypothetical protein